MDLPEDIVVEILSRLPAKAVVRFRCVSKSIRSLTMEPSFIKAHSQRSSISLNQPFFIVYGTDQLSDKRYAAVTSPSAPHHELLAFRRPPFCPPSTPSSSWDDYYFMLVGCSGGLVCLSKYSRKGDGINGMYPTSIYIWNPSLGVGRGGGEFRELHPSLPDNYCKEFLTFGFGYDSVNHDYKVVNLKRGASKSEVYSLRNGVWKDISQPFPLHCGDIEMPYDTDEAVTVNGFMHWLCMCWYYDNNYSTRYIEKVKAELVRFKLSGEVFDSISIPEEPEPCKNYRIATLSGKLCAIYSAEGHLDIWVMAEYGVVESWVKKYVLPHNPFRWPVLKGITLRGEIILLDDLQGIILYDPNSTAEEITCSVNRHLGYMIPFVANYVESLISVATPLSSKHKEDMKGEAAPAQGGEGAGFLSKLVRMFLGLFNDS